MTAIAEKPAKHAGGRPPVIDRTLADGRTVAQTVLDAIARGEWLDSAAAEAGITTETAREWLRIAARLHLAGQPPHNLTPYQTACVQFSSAHARARAAYESSGLAVIDGAARGEAKVTKVKETHRFAGPTDKVGWTERTTEVATIPPDWRAQAYRLAHLMPARYSQKVQIIDADVGLSEDEKADAVADSLEQWMEGARAGADAVRAQAVVLLRRFGDDEQVRAFLANVEAAAAEQATP